jgi:hypothetical protein
MTTFKRVMVIMIGVLIGQTIGSASSILTGWGFYTDGIFTSFDSNSLNAGLKAPENVTAFDGSNFDAGTIDLPNGITTGTGTGTITMVMGGAGSHTAAIWLDAMLDVAGGFLYADEFGTLTGSDLGPGSVDWTVNEPGYGSFNSNGDFHLGTAYADVRSGLFDNTNHLNGATVADTGDVSIGLARLFTLQANQIAAISFTSGFLESVNDLDTLSPGFFYSYQSNTNGQGVFWMTSQLQITALPIPEPDTRTLLAIGTSLLVFGRFAGRWRKNQL